MGWWPWKNTPTDALTNLSLDEFLGDGETRDASPLDLSAQSKNWQKALGQVTKKTVEQRALNLTAFSLIRGGDLFERTGAKKHEKTTKQMIDAYCTKKIIPRRNSVSQDVMDVAIKGVLRVLAGNPAVCLRMMIAKPIQVSLIPQGQDFRSYEFPRNTNPRAAGIFYNKKDAEHALLGLREEYIIEKPWLMVHEMMHAVHLMGMTAKEREMIDTFLMPVYRSRRWIEEVVAIYAERAFGAKYTPEELASPDLYGKTRREWKNEAVFSLFMSELLRA